MRFFTPELLGRIRSLDDDISDAAHDEWERAIVRSHRRWQKIKAAFPKDVQRFEDAPICLHDARLLSIGREGETFVLVLEPEPPAQTMVILTFILNGEPIIDPAALPGRSDSDWVTWMYEEFDLDRHKNCWFEVLLSNGWSVKLPCRDFHYLVAQKLFPVPKVPAAQIPGEAVPRSA